MGEQIVVLNTKEQILKYIKSAPDRVQIELDYMSDNGNYGWRVYHLSDGRYFYYEFDDMEEILKEVVPIAVLKYDVSNDIQVDGDILDELFDNFCCGETVLNDHIEYQWYDTID